MLLLNPGPVTLSERVRKSLLQTDLCHREPEFFDLQDEARQRLVAAYELDPAVWSAVLMTGSGTAAVESMIAGLVPEGGRRPAAAPHSQHRLHRRAAAARRLPLDPRRRR